MKIENDIFFLGGFSVIPPNLSGRCSLKSSNDATIGVSRSWRHVGELREAPGFTAVNIHL